MIINEFLIAADTYALMVGGSITSARRSPQRNAAVGGHPHSAHLEGLGADVVPDPGISDDERHKIAHDLKLKLIIEDDHDHLQPADWRPAKITRK